MAEKESIPNILIVINPFAYIFEI